MMRRAMVLESSTYTQVGYLFVALLYSYFQDVFHVVLLLYWSGDDAGQVKWADIDSGTKLYASHEIFIHQVAQKHDCHW